MDWKKVAESQDLIVLEKKVKDFKLKIEARKNSEGWAVFKTKVKQGLSNLLSEHSLDDFSKVQKLIEKLKDESYKPKKNLLKMYLRREIKEDFLEKWYFIFEKHKNVVYVKYEENMHVDIILNSKLKLHEKRIINQIEDKLGLKELGESITYDIFYYVKHSTIKKKNAIDTIDIEFDFTDDY